MSPLTAARLTRRWTIRHLANLTGLLPGTISDIERGLYLPSRVTLDLLRTALPELEMETRERGRPKATNTP